MKPGERRVRSHGSWDAAPPSTIGREFKRNSLPKGGYTASLCRTFAAPPEAARRSITFNDSPEFACYQKLREDLAMQSFFCDPHSP